MLDRGDEPMMTVGRIVFAPTKEELEEKYNEEWRRAIRSGLLDAMKGADLKSSLREFFPTPKPVPLDLDGVHP